MADTPSPPTMPAPQAEEITSAFGDYRRAIDPKDAWANALLASVVRASHAAGWSRRTIAAALGLSREKTEKLTSTEPAADPHVPAYTRGASYPQSAISLHQQLEARVRERRVNAEHRLVGLVRGAHECGWPYPVLGSLLGVTGERVRQIAESPVTVSPTTTFPLYRTDAAQPEDKPQPAPPPLDPVDVKKLRELKDAAAVARRLPGTRRAGTEDAQRTLDARKASENLSALIAKLKGAGATWPQLDEACGYKTGGARARAIRHGYGTVPPSMKPYTSKC